MRPGALLARLTHLASADGPRLLRDLASLVSGQFTSMVVAFIAFASLARKLDPSDYGALEFAISVAAFGAMVIDCGAGQIGVRELIRAPHRAPQIAAQVMTARAWLMLPILALIAVSGWATGHSGEEAALVGIVALTLLMVPLKQDWLLQGREKMHLAALAQPIRTLVFAAGVLFFVTSDSSVLAVGWIETASAACMALFYVAAQYLSGVPFRFDWPARAPIYFLRQGLAVGLSNILWAFMLYVPMMLLAALSDGSGTAWLGAAQRIVISLLTLSFLYHFNLYPVIARSLQRDRAVWERVIAASVHVIAWAATGVALFLTLLADAIMRVVFGPEFIAAAPVLMVLAWLFPLRLQTGHARWSLVASGGQKYLLAAEILGAVTLVGVGLVAIPRLDAPGAALALACGILASGVATQIAVNRRVGPMAVLRPMLYPLALSALAIAVGFSVTTDPALRGLIGALIFFGLGAPQIPAFLRNLQRVGYAKEVK